MLFSFSLIISLFFLLLCYSHLLALAGQFMLQSLTNITASYQAHKAAGEPCSIRVLWKKASVFPGELRALAAVFIPGIRFIKAPLKRTHSLGAKKTRTIQMS